LPLRYHQATFDLLGKPPRRSRTAIAAIEERERALGFSLPASLRELYSLSGVCDLLTDHSDQDPVVPVAELGSDPEELELGVLKFQDENQGVGAWYVRLDGSDDPPVELEGEFDRREPPEGVEDWTFRIVRTQAGVRPTCAATAAGAGAGSERVNSQRICQWVFSTPSRQPR
jgi:hypothetical protein